MMGRMTRQAIENAKNTRVESKHMTRVTPQNIQEKETKINSPVVQKASIFPNIFNSIGNLFNNENNNYDSANEGLQAIFDHKKRFGINSPYSVTNKKNGTYNIYQNGDELVKSIPITLGSNVGDGMMPLDIKYLGESPRTTGAGVYTLRARKNSPYPGNEPMFILRSDSIGPVAQAFHSPANLTTRREFFRNPNSTNRVSYGCISGDCGVLSELYNNKLINDKDTLYVLPEIEGNKLIEKDGKLQMVYGGNNPKTYKDSKGKTRKFRYNNNK